MVLCVTKCAQHFRAEVNEADFEIFIYALRDEELWRIEKAFERCLNECQFMPKLADVWKFMLEKEPEPQKEILEEFAGQEWTEDGYRYRGDPKGYRVVVGRD